MLSFYVSFNLASINLQVYKTLSTRVAITSLEIWNTKNLINVTDATSSNLDQVTKYNFQTMILERRGKHDNAILLTLVV